MHTSHDAFVGVWYIGRGHGVAGFSELPPLMCILFWGGSPKPSCSTYFNSVCFCLQMLFWYSFTELFQCCAPDVEEEVLVAEYFPF